MKYVLPILFCVMAFDATQPATEPVKQIATAPTTSPAQSTGDPAIDFLLGAATDAHEPAATRPTTQPANPFAGGKDRQDVRIGTIVLSDGQRLRGRLTTTPDKPIRVWIEKEKEHRDIPFAQIKSIQATLLWERNEKEWRFRDSGSDIKQYSGKTYPLRELAYTFTLIDGQVVHGGVVAPIYLETDDGPVLYILHKRQKGTIGQSLKDLVYVVRVE